MSNVAIFGSIGVNIGDELMGRVLANFYKGNGFEISVSSMNPNLTSKLYGERVFDSSIKKIIRWIPFIKQSDFVVLGGGTLIQNDFGRFGYSGILLYSCAVIVLSKLMGKKVLVLGVGANKVEYFNYFLSNAFKLADIVVVRDKISYDVMKNMGIKNLQQSWDIGICRKYFDQPNNSKELKLSTGKYVLLSLVKENVEIKSFDFGRFVIERAIKDGEKVKLVPMDRRADEEIEIYNKLIKLYPDTCEVVNVDYPGQVYDLMKYATKIFGMRLHFCVIALAARRKPLIFSRETKLNWIADLVGAKVVDLHADESSSTICKIVREIENSYFELGASEIQNLESAELMCEKMLNNFGIACA